MNKERAIEKKAHIAQTTHEQMLRAFACFLSMYVGKCGKCNVTVINLSKQNELAEEQNESRE